MDGDPEVTVGAQYSSYVSLEKDTTGSTTEYTVTGLKEGKAELTVTAQKKTEQNGTKSVEGLITVNVKGLAATLTAKEEEINLLAGADPVSVEELLGLAVYANSDTRKTTPITSVKYTYQKLDEEDKTITLDENGMISASKTNMTEADGDKNRVVISAEATGYAIMNEDGDGESISVVVNVYTSIEDLALRLNKTKQTVVLDESNAFALDVTNDSNLEDTTGQDLEYSWTRSSTKYLSLSAADTPSVTVTPNATTLRSATEVILTASVSRSGIKGLKDESAEFECVVTVYPANTTTVSRLTFDSDKNEELTSVTLLAGATYEKKIQETYEPKLLDGAPEHTLALYDAKDGKEIEVADSPLTKL